MEWSRREAWTWGAGQLQRAGIGAPDASREADILLRHAAGLSREEVLARPEVLLDAAASAVFRDLIARRAGGAPAAYLVGHRAFLDIDLVVDHRALIPRPETEHLVEVLADTLRGCTTPLVVDIGTGSGAIAIAVARLLPHARVLATDVSGPALALARLNAARSGVADRLRWAQGPALDPLDGVISEGSVDALASNPPYIPTSELARLPKEIREHEPAAALDGGPDGLDVHRPIIAGAARYLVPGGMLALEVAALWDQASTVAGLIAATARFRPPRIVRDYAGLDRLVVAIRSTDGWGRGRARPDDYRRR
jgi:release factor glutamine methyltransferase